MSGEEFTPRELGLLSGHAWAVLASPEECKAVADEELVPDDVMDMVLQAGVRERMLEFDEPDAAEGEFWRGFVHGVRAYIVEDLARVARSN